MESGTVRSFGSFDTYVRDDQKLSWKKLFYKKNKNLNAFHQTLDSYIQSGEALLSENHIQTRPFWTEYQDWRQQLDAFLQFSMQHPRRTIDRQVDGVTFTQVLNDNIDDLRHLKRNSSDDFFLNRAISYEDILKYTFRD
jgi:hypothetical protein